MICRIRGWPYVIPKLPRVVGFIPIWAQRIKCLPAHSSRRGVRTKIDSAADINVVTRFEPFARTFLRPEAVGPLCWRCVEIHPPSLCNHGYAQGEYCAVTLDHVRQSVFGPDFMRIGSGQGGGTVTLTVDTLGDLPTPWSRFTKPPPPPPPNSQILRSQTCMFPIRRPPRVRDFCGRPCELQLLWNHSMLSELTLIVSSLLDYKPPPPSPAGLCK